MTTRRNTRRVILVDATAALLMCGLLAGVAAASTAKTAAFEDSKAITRTHLIDGAEQLVDERSFRVSVDQTTLLRDRQEINVTWSGAHPSGGLVGDQNSGFAAHQEYPVVVMQCRGVDSGSAPASRRLSPETCWTQTPQERSQYDQTFNFPPYRLDRFASPGERKAQVGFPSPTPEPCVSVSSGVHHWVPFRDAEGKVYPVGPSGCGGMPPEALEREAALQPSNTTYGASNASGAGSAEFVIATTETNASLGCSNNVTCSLVIVPIMGVSCDPSGTGLPEEDRPPEDAREEASRRCLAKGKFAPGIFASSPNQGDLAVTGLLWWTESNWRNRISVPLGFAQGGNICDLLNTSSPVYIYGSQLMVQATTQWAPTFCLNPKLFKLQHVQTGEPQAKNLLSAGSIEAALIGNPPDVPFSRPTVQAPVALTGFAISYGIDDVDGRPYRKLKLTPRLLAKLMTESYPAAPAIAGNHPDIGENPVNIALDPEFKALNRGTPPPFFQTEPAATLFLVSSDTDVIWALTSYIQEDPAARKWLDGEADPWGMVVNPKYKRIKLPVVGWPLLDTFQGKGAAYDAANNPCLAENPVPFLPLVASPLSSFSQVTLNMQFGIAASQILCANAGLPNQRLVARGRENPGQRFLIGVTPLADAERYQLDTAALQTHVSSSAPEKFTDATGRTFVEPSNDSLRAAAKMLKADETAGSWRIPYADLRTDTGGPQAYPGTMLMSVAVPTKGLATKTAQRYAQFLRFAAVNGQRPGFGNGQLPPGYLPMTATNGLGSQMKYTQVAAAAVAAQAGGVPSVTTFKTDISTSGGAPGSSIAPPPGFVPPGALPGVGSTLGPGVSPIALTDKTKGIGSGLAGLAIPLVLGLALIGAVASAATWYIRRRATA